MNFMKTTLQKLIFSSVNKIKFISLKMNYLLGFKLRAIIVAKIIQFISFEHLKVLYIEIHIQQLCFWF